MTFNLASAWEAVSAVIPDRDALICGDHTVSWGEFERRASRVARALEVVGLTGSDNVGLCLFNGNEYLEAQFAAMKLRCSPFNISYRYTAMELRDLIGGAHARAVFFSGRLVDRFSEIHADLGDEVTLIQVGQPDEVAPWALGYEALVESSAPAPPIEREPDDLWFLFTGGTTGVPKGVMWPHSSLVGNLAPRYEAIGVDPPTTVEEVADRVAVIHDQGLAIRQFAVAPLMHGTSGLGALYTLTQGGAVLTLPNSSFDARAVWHLVADQKATHLSIVGDAFARPMVRALDEAAAAGVPHDLSSVVAITSSGLMWSATLKADLLRYQPTLKLVDTVGSSEGVGFARKIEDDARATTTARFVCGPNARVLTEDDRDVVAGSGEKGRLAVSGFLPLGYYDDPVKSAETFPVIDGVRYSIPGDWATVEADGSILLLGRGSVSINTGGEKVYPEEVEEALKGVPEVLDVNVVGVADEVWGQAIVAVLQLSPGATVDDTTLNAAVRSRLAAYKAPKSYVRVDDFVRSPNGKSDYKWALRTAQQARAAE